MPKTKISEFSATPANNTDIDSINIAEGCAPSGINDAIRELMAQLKDFQVGSAGDPVTVGGVLTVQAGAVGTPAITTAGDTNTGIFFPAADTIAFAEGGAESLRITSAGDVGIGTTAPTAFGAGTKNLQISGTSSGFIQTVGTTAGITNEMTTSSVAGILGTRSNHPLVFKTNDAEKIRLDTSGNLGIGTTSPNSKLNVNNGFLQVDISGTQAIRVGSTDSIVGGSDNNGILQVNTSKALLFYAGGSEYARFNTSGNFGIGTTSPAARLNVSSTGNGYRALFDDTTNDNTLGVFSDSTDIRLVSLNNARGSYKRLGFQSNVIVFSASNGSESCRIDTSGNFLFGTSALSGNGLVVYPDGSDTDVPLIDCRGNSSSNSLKSYRVFSVSLGQEQFYVSYAGTVFARSTSISALSDQREKQNIRPLETGLTEVLALQPRRFDWKNGQGENVAGFIAQEVQAVLPDLIDEYSLSDTEKRMALKMGDMIPTLVKAIQEMKSIIDDQAARIATLEAK